MISLILIGLGLSAAGAGAYTYFKKPAPIQVEAPVVEPRIVASVMSAAAVKHNKPLALRIEHAMAAAVTDALERGVKIENSLEIKEAMLAAREHVLAQAKQEHI